MDSVILAADGFDVASFTTSLTGGATQAVAFIAAGVGGGVIVMAAKWGLTLGVQALKKVGR